MHEVEGLLAILGRSRLESVKRAFIATYKILLSPMAASLEASLRSPQIHERMYQILRSVELHDGRQLIPSLNNALKAPHNAMSIEVAKLFKVQD